jgi:RNA-directed DNA polymerase
MVRLTRPTGVREQGKGTRMTSEKGRAMARQLTAKDRVARTLKAINLVCRSMRTRPLHDQHQRLRRMLKGH